MTDACYRFLFDHDREDRERSVVDVHVRTQWEQIIGGKEEGKEEESSYAHYLWPSALVLCQYLRYEMERHCCHGQGDAPSVILELGAGCALPSFLMAKLLMLAYQGKNDRRPWVVATDCDDATILGNIVTSGNQLNGINCVHHTDENEVARAWREGVLLMENQEVSDPKDRIGLLVTPLSWGYLWDDGHICAIRNLSQASHRPLRLWIIGADVFFKPQLFEDLIASVATIMDTLSRNRNAAHEVMFITTYHERNEHRSIVPLLRKWNLIAEEVALSEFMSVPDNGAGISGSDDQSDFTRLFDHFEDMSPEQVQRKYDDIMSNVHLVVIRSGPTGDK